MTIDKAEFGEVAVRYTDALGLWQQSTETARAHALSAEKAQQEMKLREAILISNGIEGSNAEQRSANLLLRLTSDKVYEAFRQQYEEQHQGAQESMDIAEAARYSMRLLTRMLDWEIALARLGEARE